VKPCGWLRRWLHRKWRREEIEAFKRYIAGVPAPIDSTTRDVWYGFTLQFGGSHWLCSCAREDYPGFEPAPMAAYNKEFGR
jgi:hypothetical protein